VTRSWLPQGSGLPIPVGGGNVAATAAVPPKSLRLSQLVTFITAR